MSIFAGRPTESIMLTSQCFQARAQLTLGVPVTMCLNRGGQPIRRNLNLDQYGWALTTLANTSEGHRYRMHNALLYQLKKTVREADFWASTDSNNRLLTEQLTQAQIDRLLPQSSKDRIIPDLVVELGEALPEYKNRSTQDPRAICDVKTVGVTQDFLSQAKKGHRTTSRSGPGRPCAGVEARGRKVHEEYVAKTRKLDARIRAGDQELGPGPVEQRLRSFARVRGIAVGPFCEVSQDLRSLIKPAMEKIAEKRQGRMIIHNLTLKQTETAVYNSFRCHVGLLMHSQWYEVMLRSMKHVGRSLQAVDQPLDIGELLAEIPEGPEATRAAFVAEGELGV